MAEQQDGKPKLPLTGLFALLAMVSSFFIYHEISLQTSRPVAKGPATHIVPEKNVVPSRLWQDPFEALEGFRTKGAGTDIIPPNSAEIRNLVNSLRDAGLSSGPSPHLRLMPVFMDGSPYSSGTETRLNDRYAVISALGAAGYVPESGESLRFLRWRDSSTGTSKAQLIIPVELFLSKAAISDSPQKDFQGRGSVLVLWLKSQDFSPYPLAMLSDLLADLDVELQHQFPHLPLAHDVLGPRSSSGLSAMVKEIEKSLSQKPGEDCPLDSSVIPHFSKLQNVSFYSPWATAEDTFLMDEPIQLNEPCNHEKPGSSSGILPEKSGACQHISSSRDGAAGNDAVERTFRCAGIGGFNRIIGTDAELATELVRELHRRKVDLAGCERDGCDYKIALISEWDTPYGRALPRTFAAVALTEGTGGALEPAIDKLRRDEWPAWISRHSYLAGLDGELPARRDENGDKPAQPRDKPWYEHLVSDPGRIGGELPEGRSQLDYLIRLAAALKQEEALDGKEFRAIGVLGSDVYDKLLILQALRQKFPRSIFFTTDLNARLAVSSQWKTTRNLIVASHFGLNLRPDLQEPILPFRDSYQTSLFYATLLALKHLEPVEQKDCPDCVRFERPGTSRNPPHERYRNTGPRLYEIGRQGPFDISTDPVSAHPSQRIEEYRSIHPARPDISAMADTLRIRQWTEKAIAALVILLLGGMLISSTIAHAAFRLATDWRTLLFIAAGGTVLYTLAEWVMSRTPNLMEAEPFTLTDGISAWPTAIIRLVALAASLFFLWHIWRKMKINDGVLARKFDLEEESEQPKPPGPSAADGSYPLAWWRRTLHTCLGVHLWHPQSTPEIDAAQLWNEYRKLGQLKNFMARGFPQVIIALCFIAAMMALFGIPNTPCRGISCFDVNDGLILLGVAMMMTLIFYVVDATRLCRRWVNCIAMNRIRWSDSTRSRLASANGIRQEHLDEWLGIELIADRTTVIGNFIYYPFIVMFLIGIARHPYLDNWGFPVSLAIIFVLNALLVFINGMVLRRSAETAKRETIDRLETRLAHLSGLAPDEARQKQQIEWSLRAIRNNRRGAFLPFTEHPVFGATVALPSGGYGLVLLMEYLATIF